jgi:NAD(P)-dependent dehydrogenase (short-subunit alcohol dehydrogenase family)
MKTILITGSTDGIGLLAAKLFAARGHHVLLHGRNPDKLEAAERMLRSISGVGPVSTYQADLSDLDAVEAMARQITADHTHLDVLINNAGVFHTSTPTTPSGQDVRFVVNTIAPYLLTQLLLPTMNASGRVLNLSSAAQAPVSLDALAGRASLSHGAAYSQSKLAITMWSRHLALHRGDDAPIFISVNPGSMLGTKMVRQGFGVSGHDVGIGARILERLALEDGFASANGLYFDNDARRLADPHPHALDPSKVTPVVRAIEDLLASRGRPS